jgi:hypothetical protein
MKKIYHALTLLILNFAVSVNAIAAETTRDMSAADETIQTFFTAIKADDTKKVEAMLSPRIKGLIQTKKFSIQEYIKAWGAFPPVEFGKAVDITPPDVKTLYAKAMIVYVKDGKEIEYSVRLVQIDNKWLWDEK